MRYVVCSVRRCLLLESRKKTQDTNFLVVSLGENGLLSLCRLQGQPFLYGAIRVAAVYNLLSVLFGSRPVGAPIR